MSILSGESSAKKPKCPVFMAITGISTKSNLCTVCKKDPSPPIDIISSVFSSNFELTKKLFSLSFLVSNSLVYMTSLSRLSL